MDKRIELIGDLGNAIYMIKKLHDEDVFQTDSDGEKVWTGIDVVQSDGEVLGWEDYVCVDIPTTDAYFNSGEKVVVDYLLLFGDGLIEFHDVYGCESYCWDNFDNETIKRITDILVSLA